eukprot:TRINITY_DN651_c0_g1_i1.p1 TRINITY_DN651_c0_g1~~TRINITY_DN651_c0_g1_i1.p1  ORF type:complete len:1320 (-),score=366.77 TRINITY_DN651_c0_g1_i1:109-4068(-)
MREKEAARLQEEERLRKQKEELLIQQEAARELAMRERAKRIQGLEAEEARRVTLKRQQEKEQEEKYAAALKERAARERGFGGTGGFGESGGGEIANAEKDSLGPPELDDFGMENDFGTPTTGDFGPDEMDDFGMSNDFGAGDIAVVQNDFGPSELSNFDDPNFTNFDSLAFDTYAAKDSSTVSSPSHAGDAATGSEGEYNTTTTLSLSPEKLQQQQQQQQPQLEGDAASRSTFGFATFYSEEEEGFVEESGIAALDRDFESTVSQLKSSSQTTPLPALGLDDTFGFGEEDNAEPQVPTMSELDRVVPGLGDTFGFGNLSEVLAEGAPDTDQNRELTRNMLRGSDELSYQDTGQWNGEMRPSSAALAKAARSEQQTFNDDDSAEDDSGGDGRGERGTRGALRRNMSSYHAAVDEREYRTTVDDGDLDRSVDQRTFDNISTPQTSNSSQQLPTLSTSNTPTMAESQRGGDGEGGGKRDSVLYTGTRKRDANKRYSISTVKISSFPSPPVDYVNRSPAVSKGAGLSEQGGPARGPASSTAGASGGGAGGGGEDAAQRKSALRKVSDRMRKVGRATSRQAHIVIRRIKGEEAPPRKQRTLGERSKTLNGSSNGRKGGGAKKEGGLSSSSSGSLSRSGKSGRRSSRRLSRTDIQKILHMNRFDDISKSLPVNFPPPPPYPGDQFSGGSQEDYKVYMRQRVLAEEWDNALVAFKMRQRQGDAAAMQGILLRLRAKLSALQKPRELGEEGESEEVPTMIGTYIPTRSELTPNASNVPVGDSAAIAAARGGVTPTNAAASGGTETGGTSTAGGAQGEFGLETLTTFDVVEGEWDDTDFAPNPNNRPSKRRNTKRGSVRLDPDALARFSSAPSSDTPDPSPQKLGDFPDEFAFNDDDSAFARNPNSGTEMGEAEAVAMLGTFAEFESVDPKSERGGTTGLANEPSFEEMQEAFGDLSTNDYYNYSVNEDGTIDGFDEFESFDHGEPASPSHTPLVTSSPSSSTHHLQPSSASESKRGTMAELSLDEGGLSEVGGIRDALPDQFANLVDTLPESESARNTYDAGDGTQFESEPAPAADSDFAVWEGDTTYTGDRPSECEWENQTFTGQDRDSVEFDKAPVINYTEPPSSSPHNFKFDHFNSEDQSIRSSSHVHPPPTSTSPPTPPPSYIEGSIRVTLPPSYDGGGDLGGVGGIRSGRNTRDTRGGTVDSDFDALFTPPSASPAPPPRSSKPVHDFPKEGAPTTWTTSNALLEATEMLKTFHYDDSEASFGEGLGGYGGEGRGGDHADLDALLLNLPGRKRNTTNPVMQTDEIDEFIDNYESSGDDEFHG